MQNRGYIRIICPDCLGYGDHEDHPCSSCEGSGIMLVALDYDELLSPALLEEHVATNSSQSD